MFRQQDPLGFRLEFKWVRHLRDLLRSIPYCCNREWERMDDGNQAFERGGAGLLTGALLGAGGRRHGNAPRWLALQQSPARRADYRRDLQEGPDFQGLSSLKMLPAVKGTAERIGGLL